MGKICLCFGFVFILLSVPLLIPLVLGDRPQNPQNSRYSIKTVIPFVYNGHKYIRFVYDYSLESNTVHDPDCYCGRKQ